ncbi:hypothetical protein Nmel_017094, partial [Mimus melanotis]
MVQVQAHAQTFPDHINPYPWELQLWEVLPDHSFINVM